jgi:hypothetical protein
MRFPVYPDWKYMVQAYLGRNLSSGWETEYCWELYDERWHAKVAASHLQFLAGGSKSA